MSRYSLAVESIAYLAFRGRLALFLGTGFSKSLVELTPSWKQLAEELCNKYEIDLGHISKDFHGETRRPENIISLIPYYKKLPYTPEEGKDYYKISKQKIKKKVAEIIYTITPPQDHITLLPSYQENLRRIAPHLVFTTNYDNITPLPFEKPKIIAPHSSFDNSVDGTRIMHIHGSINNPQDIVLFEEDYLEFNANSKYFHSLLYSSFVENCTLFLGYGLNDPNIKQILFNIAHKEKKDSYGRRYLFVIEDYPKEDIKYFERTYEVDVIRGASIAELLKNIADSVDRMKQIHQDPADVQRVFSEIKQNERIEALSASEDLFCRILQYLEIHKDQRDSESLNFIVKVLESIRSASNQSGAFGEYAYLARYLIHIGNKWSDIKLIPGDFPIKFKELFEYAVDFSGDMVGESWAAARVMREQFKTQHSRNKSFLMESPKITQKLRTLHVTD